MKIIKTYLFLFLIFSCSNKSQIVEFENILGKKNSETLTLMVSDFENGYLKNKYPNLSSEKAYAKLLLDMRDSKAQSWGKLPEFEKTRFEESQLKLEIYSYVDSVWIESIESPRLFIQRKYLANDGTFHKGTSWSSFRPKDGENKDSIINNRYTWTDLNYSGRFWKALRETCQNDKFIMDYLYLADSAGPIQPEILISRILASNVDYSDYFIKRIIITGISY